MTEAQPDPVGHDSLAREAGNATATPADDLAARIAATGRAFPLQRDVTALTDALLGSLFPQLSQEADTSARRIAERLDEARRQLQDILRRQAPELDAAAVAAAFMAALPQVHARAIADAEAILAGDPAAESLDEVVAAYPGFLAIAIHRIAHALHVLGVTVVPRLMAEVAHSRSGIDIHPGAAVGDSFCIDHGTGVVIGETAILGDQVKLYQGVTLGALSVTKKAAGLKRHPTIGDRVVIYANATVLGGDTTIGADSIIGGNVFLTSSVPPGSLVYQTSGYRVRRQGDGFDGADFSI